jgi:large subunit ribosomal protein L25
MEKLEIKAEVRTDFGKNFNRRLRASGMIPAVVYGKGVDATPLVLDPKEVLAILQSDTGRNTIFKLSLAGKMRDVLIREIQVDPVKGNLVHTDLQVIALDVVRTFQIPVDLQGSPAGVQMGGILDTILHTIDVECLPADLPDSIPADVSELEIGDAIRVGSLEVGDRVKVLADPEYVVAQVTVLVEAEEEEEEEVLEEEEGAEPEVIKKGKAEGEEGEETAGEESS